MEEIIAYQTVDGTKFYDKSEAEEYERNFLAKRELSSFRDNSGITPPSVTYSNQPLPVQKFFPYDFEWYRINTEDEWNIFSKLLSKDLPLGKKLTVIKKPSIFPTLVGVNTICDHCILTEDIIMSNYLAAHDRLSKELQYIDEAFQKYHKDYCDYLRRNPETYEFKMSK